VRHAARFHHDGRARRQAIHERLELPTREPFSIDDPVGTIGDGHLEDVFCQIHRHRRSIHVGLLLVWLRATIHGNDAARKPGGVHTITAADGRRYRAAAEAAR